MRAPLSTPPLQRRTLLELGVGMGVGLATAVACSGSAAASPARASHPAPDFTLRRADGGALRLAEQRGQVVLLNFWASWCGPCKVEMPHLERLHRQYTAAGFTVLGVNIDEDPRTAQQLAARWGLSFPVLLDSDKAVSKRYALASMPTTLLIDRDGRVRHQHLGYREGLEATYEQQLRELVKE